jgi:hypothetical protein
LLFQPRPPWPAAEEAAGLGAEGRAAEPSGATDPASISELDSFEDESPAERAGSIEAED